MDLKPSKRCQFHVACGQKGTTWRWHSFLKRNVWVCPHCASTNEYLKTEAEVKP